MALNWLLLFNFPECVNMLLQVSQSNAAVPKEVCYVDTELLNGEINLKERSVMPALIGKVSPPSRTEWILMFLYGVS